MKRMHLHIGVDNLDTSLKFYSALFGAEPEKVKEDYARWMLEDPRINFAISTRSGKQGLDHLGLQVDDINELASLRDRLSTAELPLFDEGETVCCYSKSEKSWTRDPAGIAWEAYQTMADAELFSETDAENANACCSPDEQVNNCCA